MTGTHHSVQLFPLRWGFHKLFGPDWPGTKIFLIFVSQMARIIGMNCQLFNPIFDNKEQKQNSNWPGKKMGFVGGKSRASYKTWRHSWTLGATGTAILSSCFWIFFSVRFSLLFFSHLAGVRMTEAGSLITCRVKHQSLLLFFLSFHFKSHILVWDASPLSHPQTNHLWLKNQRKIKAQLALTTSRFTQHKNGPEWGHAKKRKKKTLEIWQPSPSDTEKHKTNARGPGFNPQCKTKTKIKKESMERHR